MHPFRLVALGALSASMRAVGGSTCAGVHHVAISAAVINRPVSTPRPMPVKTSIR